MKAIALSIPFFRYFMPVALSEETRASLDSSFQEKSDVVKKIRLF